MTNLPSAMTDLLDDRDGKRVEECLLALLADLEHQGIKPQAIAKATSRALLGFCLEHGKNPGRYAWAVRVVDGTGRALEERAASMRRAWVKKFMEKTARTYLDARFAVRMNSRATQDEARNAPLDVSEPVGRA